MYRSKFPAAKLLAAGNVLVLVAVDFTPGPGNFVEGTIADEWTDPSYDGWNVYYKITTIDFSGNESPPSMPDPATAVDMPEVPTNFFVYQNMPNPFNPVTVIRYDVPADGGIVTLRIYDVGGRLIRTLVDGFESAGTKSVTWRGRNDRGTRVATGVYFYRMTAPGFEQTRKMVLIQ